MINALKMCLKKPEKPFPVETANKKFMVNPDAIIPILYIGGRRCGKTTIMSSIFENAIVTAMDKNNKGLEIYIPDENTKNNLKTAINKLKDQAAEGECAVEGGIQASDGIACYEFLLYNRNDTADNACVLLKFIDVPGEIYENITQSQKSDLAKIIGDTKIILIAVDTVSLMEDANSAKNYYDYNIIESIEGIFGNLEQAAERKLFLFVPVKCEKYYEKGMADEIIKKIESKYEKIISKIKEKSPTDVIAVAPVQTVGTLVFHHYESPKEEGALPKQIFFKSENPDITDDYEPLFCDQVLWYIFRFVFSDAGAEFKKPKLSLFTRLYNWFWGISPSDKNSYKTMKAIAGAGTKLGDSLYNSANNLSEEDFQKLISRMSVCGVIGTREKYGYKVLSDKNNLFTPKRDKKP